MSTAASQVKRDNPTTTGNQSITTTGGDKDVIESTIRTVDEATKSSTGVSLFHILTLASIGGSLALFFAGKKSAAIFVGLWPPTFQALKSVADTNRENNK
ncbi:MAG: hypothetical protein QOC99_785 [Acidobacteriota bacterium]|jgi:hypothetical protein|nr:hypothetical protein [Acidobacteriota bacterium]MDT7778273.1 hypothetical protein [Acidobacteriota bacterium]